MLEGRPYPFDPIISAPPENGTEVNDAIHGIVLSI